MKKVLIVVLMLVTLGCFAPIGSAQYRNNRHRYAYRHRRTFWQKHRDKLTVAGTALGGAAIGGIAGGKKGAAIGALSGAAAGAVYTYGIRKRHHRHRRYY